MRILLVDDNLELLNMLKDNLEDLGVNCESCICSLSALQLLENDSEFDLVFTDIRLPGIDGIELSKTIKNMYQVPVILTSGDFQYSNLKNNEDFILKPYDFEEIYSIFKSISEKNLG